MKIYLKHLRLIDLQQVLMLFELWQLLFQLKKVESWKYISEYERKQICWINYPNFQFIDAHGMKLKRTFLKQISGFGFF